MTKRISRIGAFMLAAMTVLPARIVVAQPAEQESARTLLDAARELRTHQRAAPDGAAHPTVKCGLGVFLSLREAAGRMSAEEQRELSELTALPTTQKSRVIGNFTVFYDTVGIHAPGLVDANHQRIPNTVEQYVDSVGTLFNGAWNFEVDQLGYDAPPFLPSESHYDVYVQETNSGLYGFTQPVNQINTSYPPLYDSFIEIDNDYLGFYSEGMAGLKVTAAHEFHHAIQIGKYGYWSGDRYFLEITSTWMEDVVYNDVNDYYQYLSNQTDQTSQFSYPSTRFTKDDNSIEYSRAVWGKFVEERFSLQVMHSTWNYIRQSNALASLDHALQDAGSSFRQAFIEWGLWNMNTGPNADTSAYCYKEARSYPAMRMNPITTFTSGQRVINSATDVMSSAYYPFIITMANGDSARLNSLITNINTSATSAAQPFTYILSDQGDDSYRHLSIGLYAKLNVANQSDWSAQEVIIDSGNTLQPVPEIVPDIVVFPNPYLANGSSKLNFHLPEMAELATAGATLTILSNTMDRIISRDLQVVELKPREQYLQWDGYDENGRVASTGVYFYFITAGDRQFSGKFAIIRE